MQKFVPIKQLDVAFDGDILDEFDVVKFNLKQTESKNIQKLEKSGMKNSEEKNLTNEHQITKYKMTGYLKKKRNKVGGWRKIWCVLQDQLLLSFNSKEDCNKNLLSFKDILNIVPGTTVKPLDRLNFTIETTTNICYTFRCHDRESCTNWITALVESLPLKSNGSKDLLNSNGMNKYNASMDNISSLAELSKSRSLLESSIKKIPSNGKQIIRMSVSCDSIHNYNPYRSKIAKLPIAEATAKILKRNGMEDTEHSKNNNKYKSHQCVKEHTNLLENLDKIERAKNFRLHDKRVSSTGFINQSNEVSRINRLFDDNTNNCLFQNKTDNKLEKSVLNETNNSNKILENKFLNDSIRKTKLDFNDDLKNKEINLLKPIELNQLINNRENIEILCNNNNNNLVKFIEKDNNILTFGDEVNINAIFKHSTTKQRTIVKGDIFGLNNIKGNKLESYFYGMNQINENNLESSLTSSLERQINKLKIVDEEESEKFTNFKSKPKHLPESGSSSTSSRHDNRRDPMIAINENEISLSDLQKYYPIKHKEDNNVDGKTSDQFKCSEGAEYCEIIYPSSTKSNSPITQKRQSLINDTSSNSLTINNNDFIGKATSRIGDGKRKLPNEPIYAVVNLKNKYERRNNRKKIFEMEFQGSNNNETDTVDGMQAEGGDINGGKQRPKSAIFISSGDYEEVLNFSTESLDNSNDHDVSSESENIYEPINIPYDPQNPDNPHRVHPLWKYFSIDALIEMARNRKSRHNLNKLEHSISTPLSTSLTDTNHEHHSHSPFSALRRKFGNHRKSIKLRMKKFYKRKNNYANSNNSPPPVIINERNAFSDDELDSQGASGSTGSATSESLKSINGNNNEKELVKIFGNFGSLSKPRSTLCIDHNSLKRKNKIVLFSSKLNGFHRDSRRPSIKKSGRKNNGFMP